VWEGAAPRPAGRAWAHLTVITLHVVVSVHGHHTDGGLTALEGERDSVMPAPWDTSPPRVLSMVMGALSLGHLRHHQVCAHTHAHAHTHVCTSATSASNTLQPTAGTSDPTSTTWIMCVKVISTSLESRKTTASTACQAEALDSHGFVRDPGLTDCRTSAPSPPRLLPQPHSPPNLHCRAERAESGPSSVENGAECSSGTAEQERSPCP
jgi:hypothetical protein